jgi:hypothetical protein
VWTDDNEPVLITHAGLTRARWQLDCGADSDVGRIAAGLNAARATAPGWSLQAGGMLTDGLGRSRIDPVGASPVWAIPTDEVWPGWLARETTPRLLFSQMHGHLPPIWWTKGTTPTAVAALIDAGLLDIDRKARHTCLHVDGRHIWCVDPGFGRLDHGRAMTPLVLSGKLADEPARAPTYPTGPIKRR